MVQGKNQPSGYSTTRVSPLPGKGMECTKAGKDEAEKFKRAFTSSNVPIGGNKQQFNTSYGNTFSWKVAKIC